MKRIVSISLIVSIVFSLTVIVSANSDITVKINGEVQSYTQPPVLENVSTLVPLRGIFESLGATVT